jgi:hypothetical protein
MLRGSSSANTLAPADSSELTGNGSFIALNSDVLDDLHVDPHMHGIGFRGSLLLVRGGRELETTLGVAE